MRVPHLVTRIAMPARRTGIVLSALAVAVVATASHPAGAMGRGQAPAPHAAPPDLSGIDYAPRPGASLPLDAPFRDDHGAAVTLGAAMAARPTVLALGYYTCPALCGVSRSQVTDAIGHAGLVGGRDYSLVFVSIDPAEGPADAAAARTQMLRDGEIADAAPGAAFLTGPADSIDRVERAVGFHARFDAALKQFIHPAGVVIATPTGLVSSYVLGLGYTPGDLRAALVRAGSGTILERQAAPILLLCFHFDSTTGRYSLAIMKLLRLGGGLTVLLIAALLLVLRHRGRSAVGVDGHGSLP